MSHLIRQTQCPKCAENGKDRDGDNLSIYSDGHEWCYSCGYYVGANGVKKFLSKQEVIEKHEVYLPNDCDINYPDKTIQWVEKYELDVNSLLSHNVLWSEKNRDLSSLSMVQKES